MHCLSTVYFTWPSSSATFFWCLTRSFLPDYTTLLSLGSYLSQLQGGQENRTQSQGKGHTTRTGAEPSTAPPVDWHAGMETVPYIPMSEGSGGDQPIESAMSAHAQMGFAQRSGITHVADLQRHHPLFRPLQVQVKGKGLPNGILRSPSRQHVPPRDGHPRTSPLTATSPGRSHSSQPHAHTRHDPSPHHGSRFHDVRDHVMGECSAGSMTFCL